MFPESSSGSGGLRKFIVSLHGNGPLCFLRATPDIGAIAILSLSIKDGEKSLQQRLPINWRYTGGYKASVLRNLLGTMTWNENMERARDSPVGQGVCLLFFPYSLLVSPTKFQIILVPMDPLNLCVIMNVYRGSFQLLLLQFDPS